MEMIALLQLLLKGFLKLASFEVSLLLHDYLTATACFLAMNLSTSITAY